MGNRHIRIFDTTLRDGQQCPGAGMSFEKNIEYAQLARELKIDVLEAGFPSASLVDFEIVNTIAKNFANDPDSPIVAALCQMRPEQVERTIEALMPLKANKKALVHIYLPVDPELMPASLGEERANDKKGLIQELHDCTKKVTAAGMSAQFSPEGYSRVRENFDFVADLFRAAVQAGVNVINCPDTIGGASDLQGEEYFVHKMNRHAEIIRKEFPDKKIIWSVHCHNDFGLAVQNSLNAVFKGPATQIEGCINGIGERAGNASLEQCIMIIKNFAHYDKGATEGVFTSVDTKHIQKISDFVSRNMLPRQPHSPICGDNAAKHSSGGHTNAILKHPLAYQPFDPREIGKEITFAFGPLSGGNHAKSIIEQSGYKCPDEEKSVITQFIKSRFSQRRKGITDDELMQAYFEYHQPIHVKQIDYSKKGNRSELRLIGRFFSEEEMVVDEAHEGQDSALAALKRLLESKFGPFEIQSHRSYSETEGINAVSVSQIFILDESKREFEGRGNDQDIEISAMKALIDAVNRAYVERLYRTTQSKQSALATV